MNFRLSAVKNISLLTVLMLSVFTFQARAISKDTVSRNTLPEKYEWRAVWISTVNNIDWPSQPGLGSEQQKQELIEYLDLFKSLHFNAVVLQIRPTADAFYRSEYEPWSVYLTGDQKQPPVPFYDPLQFAVEQAHKRGLELHAWLNPYRITQDTSNLKDVSPEHLYRTRPELFVKHGKKCYFDPAWPESRDFVATVVKDIVRRYDIDGIHFDDYFYPDNNFNDSVSFSIHNRGYAPEDKMAWRRENVNLMVEQISKAVKEVKPYVKFGISPYAVWRNKREDPRGSDSQSYGYTNYDNLHADVLAWMENKWVDYILPQFYFNIGYEKLDFVMIKDWWVENAYGIPLYAGLGSYRLSPDAKIPAYRSSREIADQLDTIRATPYYGGVCFFTANNLKNNLLEMNTVIQKKFRYPAIPPAILPDDQRYSTPVAPSGLFSDITTNSEKSKEVKLSWSPYPGSYLFVIYRAKKGEKPNISDPANIVEITGGDNYICRGENVADYDYYITALSRYAKESEPVLVKKQNIITKTLKRKRP